MNDNSDLGAWLRRLKEPLPGLSLKDKLDAIDADALDSAVGFAAEHTRRYIATDGTDDGWDGPRPILILYTRGRRTGQLRRNPLLFVMFDGARHLIASNGGAPQSPMWFGNLLADPRVWIRDGGEVVAATARILDAEERELRWPALVAGYPMFGDYQANTERAIPLVALDPR